MADQINENVKLESPDLEKARKVILGEVSTALEAHSKKWSELMDEARKGGGEPSTETQKSVSRLEEQLKAYDENLKQLQEEFDERVKAGVENVMNRSSFLGMSGDPEALEGFKSVGKQVTDSEKFKSTFASSSSVDDWTGTIKWSTKAPQANFQDYEDLRRFYEPWSGHPWRPDGTLRPKPGSTAVFQDRPLGFLEEPLFFEQLIPTRNLPEGTRTVEFIEETRYGMELMARITSASSTAAAIEVDNANGFYAEQLVEVEVVGGAFEEATVASVNYATNTVTLDGVLTTATLANGRLRAHTFGFHLPQELKPEFEIFTPSLKSAYLNDLAIRHTMTRQILRDVPGLQVELNSAVLESMRRNRERQLMYGPGGERALQGLLTHPGRQTMSLATLRSEKSDNNITILDALHYAITQSEVSYMRANVIIMHPQDWERVAMLKDSNLRYLVAPRNDGLFNAPNVNASWGLPVITSQSIARNKVFVGNLSTAVQMYRSGGVEISIFDQHADYAARNMLMLRAEETIGVSHRRPQAIIELDVSGS